MYSSTLFLGFGTRRGWGVSVTPRPLSTPGKDPVPTVQDSGWAPGPVWMAENLALTGIRSSDRPARNQSPYRLSYPVHVYLVLSQKYSNWQVTLEIQHFSICSNVMQCSRKDISIHSFIVTITGYRGTAVAQWLRCCAANLKVAGSIPNGVTGIFHWHNPSDRTMTLGSTQPLTEMSTRRISWG